MNEQKQKIVTHTGMWLAAIVGSIYGLILTIVGYLFDWGPGSGMEGTFWEVLLVGIISVLAAAYIGELVVRKLAKKMLVNQVQILSITVRLFVVVLLGCIAAFMVGWEVGFLMGKLTGTITGMGWGQILLNVAAMSFIYSIPVCLIASIFYSVFVFFYLSAGNK